ncbi:MAG: hypothetical protein HY964_02455 [Ignavibacteriales bacterium]|nr:hypothetical protein [Ignavibacteriales bacterium]
MNMQCSFTQVHSSDQGISSFIKIFKIFCFILILIIIHYPFSLFADQITLYTPNAQKNTGTAFSDGTGWGTTSSTIRIGQTDAYEGRTSGGWTRFDISSIPDNARINSITLVVQVFENDGSGPNVDLMQISYDPVTATYQTIYDDLSDGNIYYDNAWFGSNNSFLIDLSSQAVSDLQSMLTNGDWFAVGFKYDGYYGYYARIRGYDQTNRPELIIDYTEIPTTTTVSGYIQFDDGISATPTYARYAHVLICDQHSTDRILKDTYTDANGYYSETVTNDETDGLDIFVKVLSEGKSGAYYGSNSFIASVKNPSAGPTYFKQSTVYTNNLQSFLSIDIMITDDATSSAFSIFNSLLEGFIKVKQKLVLDMPGIEAFWPSGETKYEGSPAQLFYDQDDRWDRDQILHEYGHYVHYSRSFADGPHGDYRHGWDDDLRYSPVTRLDHEARNLAFKEGWADFFAVVIQYDPPWNTDIYFDNKYGINQYQRNLEDETSRSVATRSGEYYESSVACLLWDMFDDAEGIWDNEDWFHLGFGQSPSDKIWRIADDRKPDDINGFWNGWFAKGYTDNRDITRIFINHAMSFIAQPAYSPTPIHQSTGISALIPNLSWTSGANATSQDVYVGTSSSFTSSDLKGNTTTTSWIPNLLCNQKYYCKLSQKVVMQKPKVRYGNLQLMLQQYCKKT